MTSLLKMAASVAALALIPAAANAQAAAAPAAVNTGVAVVDLEGAVGGSAAYASAMKQIETTYKAQLTALQTRQTAIQAELAPLRTEIENLQKNPATPKATLDAKIAGFQQKGQAAQAELQRLAAPVARPQAYVKEQIGAKVEQALKAAMTAKKVGLVIGPEAVVAVQGGSDLTADVIAQLNALVPSVSITPPANWQPGQAQQAAAAAGR
ncbi:MULTISPECIES: OmpH family outer membrane protein [unclassified Sphingomonas]|uniref:OmpH family outer membrane protein n=1 Tax=unclassified Sphingomonas TaxID=196159 RepID=UPI0006FB261D|nr:MULTISPECIES: OmpH family outer membrane protein [unclassified Sphingomonas]KQX19974.1 outer membrane chaperone Skp [Sphingomonas sp. Root1294]KQY67221.1 outer membrane chaperone Skp [Sphingomonas sp. Root50]KRB90595.1 outer membrane chaperone Skp [Sphingomonas sp. Root720]